MRKPHVLSFTLRKGTGYFYFRTPKEKHVVRKIVRDLNRVFIPKKVNEEFD
jgi:hypothetical protein